MFGNWFLELTGSSLGGVGILNDCLWVGYGMRMDEMR